MRIELPRTHSTTAPEPAPAEATRSTASSVGTSVGGDRVSLSAGLRLVKAALDEAKAADAGIRDDVVLRARALVASGELEADLTALAARVLPDLIDSHDDDPT